MPPGGSAEAQRVAVMQHRLARAYRSRKRGQRPPLNQLAARYGMSEATLNRAIAGTTWASSTAIAALLDAVT